MRNKSSLEIYKKNKHAGTKSLNLKSRYLIFGGLHALLMLNCSEEPLSRTPDISNEEEKYYH